MALGGGEEMLAQHPRAVGEVACAVARELVVCVDAGMASVGSKGKARTKKSKTPLENDVGAEQGGGIVTDDTLVEVAEVVVGMLQLEKKAVLTARVLGLGGLMLQLASVRRHRKTAFKSEPPRSLEKYATVSSLKPL